MSKKLPNCKKTAAMKKAVERCSTFEDLPADGPDPWPQRKIFLHRVEADEKLLHRTDAEMREMENDLRRKWPCEEAIPEGFDVDKLEAAWQAQANPCVNGDANAAQKCGDSSQECDDDDDDEVPGRLWGQAPVDTYSAVNMSLGAVSLPTFTPFYDPLPNGEMPSDRERAAKRKHICWAPNPPPIPPRRASKYPAGTRRDLGRIQPRFGAGSEPPPARSSFANAGFAVSVRQGQQSSTVLKGYPKAPRYFPWKSRLGGS